MPPTLTKWTKLVTGAIKFLPEAQWVGIVVELLTQLASSMGATSGDSKEALKHIQGLHADLAQVNAAHAGLTQQLDAHLKTQADTLALHGEKLDTLNAQLHSTWIAVDSIDERITLLHSRSRQLSYILAAFFLLLSITISLLIVIFLRLRSAN